MNESNNIFEQFINRFYIKFNKLQIKGFHGKAPTERTNRTVSPRRARMQSERFKNQYAIPEESFMEMDMPDAYQQPASKIVQNHTY